MKPIAVDIVVIPDAHLFDQALSINADLVKHHCSDIVLHAIHCLPHISLAMGGIDQDKLLDISQSLHALWREYRLVELLHTKGLVYRTNAQGATVSSIELVKDKRLQALHEKVMEWNSVKHSKHIFLHKWTYKLHRILPGRINSQPKP